MFEPGSFVPVAQAVIDANLDLLPQPTYGHDYDIDRDPVWQHKPVPKPFAALGWYQCDQLGTPMEVTDEGGEVAWKGTYKAWGLAEEARSEKARRAEVGNPLRFQGQYFDVETGLHYNRYRYYDPEVGRFVSKDPIGLNGGLNTYAYNPNPTCWVDPLGLAGNPATATHITYQGFDVNSNKPYVGYASMQGSRTGQEVLSYRYSGQKLERFGGTAPLVLYTGYGQQGKDVARGLEQNRFIALGGLEGTANAQNPVGVNNKRKGIYESAAKEYLEEINANMPICCPKRKGASVK